VKANPTGSKNAGISLTPALIEKGKQRAEFLGLNWSNFVSQLITEAVSEIKVPKPRIKKTKAPPVNPEVLPQAKKAARR